MKKSWTSEIVIAKIKKKKQVSLRLDPDVVAFFKSISKKGYQTRINAVLRAYMQANKKE